MDERFSTKRLYDKYLVKIAMREDLRGGKPKDKELLERHIIRKTGHEDELTKKMTEDAVKGLPPTENDLDEQVEKSSSGFLAESEGKHKGELYIDTFQLKAMFRQSAQMLGIYKKKRGSKNMCAEGAEIKGTVHEARVYLGKKEPDGTYMGVVHAMTPKGPISGIKHVDFVTKPVLTFEIWVLTTPAAETRHIGESDIIDILTFSQENGVGADRSQGCGKFDVVEFQKMK